MSVLVNASEWSDRILTSGVSARVIRDAVHSKRKSAACVSKQWTQPARMSVL